MFRSNWTELMRYLVLFLVTVSAAIADSPPDWGEYTIVSERKTAQADIVAIKKSNLTRPWEWQYELRVFSLGEEKRSSMLWASAYKHPGYTEGILANSGKFFIYVNYWFQQDAPTIEVYSYGKHWAIDGRELRLNYARLERSASHRLWINERPKLYEAEKNASLEMHTSQGVRILDLYPEPHIRR